MYFCMPIIIKMALKGCRTVRYNSLTDISLAFGGMVRKACGKEQLVVTILNKQKEWTL
jgi:hypothetical protein